MKRTGRTLKLRLVLLVIAASGLALLAWSQVWVDVRVVQGSSTVQLPISGSTAAGALSALSLAGIALAGALTIAGPVIRVVLGALEVLLGFSVSLGAGLAIGNPAAASAAAITKATGIAGNASIQDGVTAAALTPWAFAGFAAGVVMVAAGVGILVTGPRWPGTTSRYQAVRFESADGAPGALGAAAVAPGTTAGADDREDAVITWDGLTRGDDPTDTAGDR
ncbi:Trp biosynthesis-associated membrane protein [Cryobacterium breve]|uniref:Trp biosynthesis-associated membrane protein n=1 Tax=Cryobacterium breve TaxID=1259258 RepID=A0ABY7NF74_9MICO|nr:Trp biosynthesis-associated membrane protein [Cryobacterium breve]WBM80422.1 Trp biosynthesis-associated membrane protein [Cryobacterium breve]